VVVLEEGAGAAQALVARQRHGPGVAHVLLLVGQDEQDVVAAVVRAGASADGKDDSAAAGDAGVWAFAGRPPDTVPVAASAAPVLRNFRREDLGLVTGVT